MMGSLDRLFDWLASYSDLIGANPLPFALCLILGVALGVMVVRWYHGDQMSRQKAEYENRIDGLREQLEGAKEVGL